MRDGSYLALAPFFCGSGRGRGQRWRPSLAPLINILLTTLFLLANCCGRLSKKLGPPILGQISGPEKSLCAAVAGYSSPTRPASCRAVIFNYVFGAPILLQFRCGRIATKSMAPKLAGQHRPYIMPSRRPVHSFFLLVPVPPN